MRHSTGQYVVGDVHTNGIERGLSRTIRPPHLTEPLFRRSVIGEHPHQLYERDSLPIILSRSTLCHVATLRFVVSVTIYTEVVTVQSDEIKDCNTIVTKVDSGAARYDD